MGSAKKYIVLILLWFGVSPNQLIASDIVADNTSSSDEAVFFLKAEKQLLGGSVLVFNENFDLVTVSTIRRRRLEIDFSTADFGVYTVRIIKGNEMKEFHFMKK